MSTKTWLLCKACGHREDDVIAVFYGFTCPECGAVDEATIRSRTRRTKDGS